DATPGWMPRLERARPPLGDGSDQLGDRRSRHGIEAVELHAHLRSFRPGDIGVAQILEQALAVARGHPQLEQIAARLSSGSRDARPSRADVEEVALLDLASALDLHRQVRRHPAMTSNVLQAAELA